ncbi:MAG TPA: 2-phospho-L-lactate guanylyltransferase [Nocardioidaceae bacterium]|nr:2-phospho-L-lactate guanylyltransferase [Nocardioidaceae bacterium]
MYGVVVPVKPPAVAKSRLAALGDPVRRDLCAAFAVDTVVAVAACPLVERVLVVTDDATLAAVLADLGVDVIPDGVGDDLNGSLALGAAELHRRSPGLRLAAVFADLPALRPEELAEALHDAADDRMSFVADAEGTGTTTVVAPTLELFRPSFGPDSRQAHLDAGAREILRELPGLRHDVDTPEDLAVALELGAGERTAFVATVHAAALG